MGMPLVREDLIRAVAKATRLRKGEARIVVDKILDQVVAALRRGERVEIRGLGSFAAPLVTGRKGRDLKTGREIPLPPRRKPVFKPGQALKPRPTMEPTVDKSGQTLMFPQAPGAGPTP